MDAPEEVSPPGVESLSLEDQLNPFVYLGNYNALEIFPLLNLVFVGYGCIWFLPRWKYTPTLVLVTSLFYSVIYGLTLFSLLFGPHKMEGPLDFTKFESVVNSFQDPHIVFLGWVHYIAFDLLVARQILLDSLERKVTLAQHSFLILPVTFLTLMLGPCGFFAYQVIIAPIFLSPKGGAQAASAPKEKVIKRV
jgi:hypothetical protein